MAYEKEIVKIVTEAPTEYVSDEYVLKGVFKQLAEQSRLHRLTGRVGRVFGRTGSKVNAGITALEQQQRIELDHEAVVPGVKNPERIIRLAKNG